MALWCLWRAEKLGSTASPKIAEPVGNFRVELSIHNTIEAYEAAKIIFCGPELGHNDGMWPCSAWEEQRNSNLRFPKKCWTARKFLYRTQTRFSNALYSHDEDLENFWRIRNQPGGGVWDSFPSRFWPKIRVSENPVPGTRRPSRNRSRRLRCIPDGLQSSRWDQTILGAFFSLRKFVRTVREQFSST